MYFPDNNGKNRGKGKYQVFGEKYNDYKKRTTLFVPFLF